LIKIHVHYTTQLKAELGIEGEELEIAPPCQFTDLLQRLIVRHPAEFQRLVVDESGKLLPSILLCVDDQQISPCPETTLEDGASVMFLSAISGG
jgi:molybdopterin converting factor small subunit